MPILAGIVLTFAIAAAWQMGLAAGHALWFAVALALIGFVGLALWLWHRRRLNELRELYSVEFGGWNRASWHREWPKWCSYCGNPADNWRQAGTHNDPETSPCARYLAHREALEADPESLPMAGWTADVIGPRPGETPPAREAAGALTEGP